MYSFSKIIQFSLLVLLFFSCASENKEVPKVYHTYQQLSDFFNSKGRYKSKFKNEDLLFGDTLSWAILHFMSFDSIEQGSKRYFRSQAFIRESGIQDSSFYFIYGVSSRDSILDELRIRTFLNGEYVKDYLLIDKKASPNVDYSYLVLDCKIEIQGQINQKKHYSDYTFFKGQLFNQTLVPDTVFEKYPRQFYLKESRPIVIYNHYESKDFISLKGESHRLTGKFVGWYGNHKLGQTYRIIALDKNSLIQHPYVSIKEQRNQATPLFLLTSKEVFQKEDLMEAGILYWPKGKITRFPQDVYVDYLNSF